jgi:adenylate kinase family enzyme
VASALAQALGYPHVELDSIFHQPGWTPLEAAEFRRRVEEATESTTWVVDGNYSAIRDVVWERADTVVYLDLPLHAVLSRLVPRTVRRVIGRTELWNGNREPLSNLWSINPEKSVIAWAVAHHSTLRTRYVGMIADPRWSDLHFIRLCTSTQITQFLKNVRDFAEETE